MPFCKIDKLKLAIGRIETYTVLEKNLAFVSNLSGISSLKFILLLRILWLLSFSLLATNN
jgi:hypothetical protein